MNEKKLQKKKPLTVRERKLIKGLCKGLSVAEAARQAGYANSTIEGRIYSKDMLGSVRIQRALKDMMDEMGISDEKLLNVIREGLEAHKVTTDGEKAPDFSARHKYLETALELKGHRKTAEQPAQQDNNFTQINVNLDFVNSLPVSFPLPTEIKRQTEEN